MDLVPLLPLFMIFGCSGVTWFCIAFLFVSTLHFCWEGFGNIPTNSFCILVYLVLCTFVLSLPLLSHEKSLYLLLVIISCFFFKSSNLVFLFLTFESSLMPIVLLILYWGYQPERVSAAFYLFVYGFLSGVPLILVFSSDKYVPIVIGGTMVSSTSLFWLGTIGFLVKSPIYLFHVWLPKAHVEAPTLGSVMLAGILLKQGTYGAFSLLSLFKHYYLCFYIILGVLGSCFATFSVFMQTDLKAWVALSSVVHMNVLLMGLFTFSLFAKEASLFIMFLHGVVSSLMFIGAGTLIHSYQDRSFFSMSNFSGPEQKLLSVLFYANMGVPPFLSFFAEMVQVSVIFSFSNLLGFVWFLNFLGVTYYCLFVVQIFNKSKGVGKGISPSLNLNFSVFTFLTLNTFLVLWGG